MESLFAKHWSNTDSLVKIAYITLFCAKGSFEPFLGSYLALSGYDLSQVGFLVSISPFVAVIVAPLVTFYCDKHNNHGKASLLFGILNGVLSLFIAFSTPKGNLPNVAVPAFFIVLQSICRAPLQPLLDAAGVRSLAGRTELYGKLRLFGSIGYCSSAFISSSLVDIFGSWVAFAFFLTFSSLAGIVLNRLFSLLPSASKSTSASVTNSSFGDVVSIVLSHKLFFTLVLVAGFNTSVVSNMLPVFMRKTLSAPAFAVGLSIIIASGISEVPCFILSPKITRMVPSGTDGVILVGLAATALRMFLCRLSATVASQQVIAIIIILFSQLLHGVCFSLMWHACVSICDSLAPNGLQATFQGLLSALFTGLACGLGAFVSGTVIENYSPQTLFFGVAVVNVIMFGVYLFGNGVGKQQKSSQTDKKDINLA